MKNEFDVSKFKVLTSLQNPLIKQIKVLQSTGVKGSKARQESGLALIEGIHLLDAWISHGEISSLATVVTTNSGLNHPEIAQIIEGIQIFNQNNTEAQIQLILIEEPLWGEISELSEGAPLMALTRIPTTMSLSECVDDVVILDAIQDAGNVGTILRTAAAAGVKNIVCIKGTAQIWSPKVLRSGMGAHIVLKIWEGLSVEELFAEIKLPLISARLNNASSLYQLSESLAKPLGWVFGNEGQGVCQAIEDNSIGAFIPQISSVESLNVASAAAICLFEMRRVRLISNV